MVPFEWLSSPDIVIESIESCFNNAADKKFHVVDFGSGSSLLAIKLLRTHARHVDKVSNLDYNAEALSIALNNMSDDDQINLSQGKIKYHCINLARSFTAEQHEMILKHKIKPLEPDHSFEKVVRQDYIDNFRVDPEDMWSGKEASSQIKTINPTVN